MVNTRLRAQVNFVSGYHCLFFRPMHSLYNSFTCHLNSLAYNHQQSCEKNIWAVMILTLSWIFTLYDSTCFNISECLCLFLLLDVSTVNVFQTQIIRPPGLTRSVTFGLICMFLSLSSSSCFCSLSFLHYLKIIGKDHIFVTFFFKYPVPTLLHIYISFSFFSFYSELSLLPFYRYQPWA